MMPEDSYVLATKIIAALDEHREWRRAGRLLDKQHLSSSRGAVLVFLPGMGEIEIMRKILMVKRLNKNK